VVGRPVGKWIEFKPTSVLMTSESLKWNLH